ncbi:MAG TPA: branched-chain amino acid ABC transporter permease [Symbiobacteriaceae bacterium]|jgi:branched-chain amino acid transport system permease protein|nr:branched-chain amino acid ABC transporter permease [Symbiobacteriaceae bacterium]
MNESLRILPQILVDGLVVGALYAVVALGYTMVYGVLEFINFAHSEIFMFGAFIGAEVFLLFKPMQGVPQFVPLILGLILSMLVAGALGWIVERIAYRPLRGAPKLVPLISAIGVSFFLQDAARMIWTAVRGNWQIGTQDLYGQGLQFAGAQIQVRTVLIMAIAIVLMLALSAFVNRSRTGKAMRAVAQDRSTAALMGINVNSIISITFLIGGALGGAAGALYTMQYTVVNPYIGFVMGIKAFTAAVFGGIGNTTGAAVGGLCLGLFEALGSAYLGPLTGGVLIGSEYKDIIAFSILILVLIFKPAGLLGETVGEKV